MKVINWTKPDRPGYWTWFGTDTLPDTLFSRDIGQGTFWCDGGKQHAIGWWSYEGTEIELLTS